MRQNLQFKIFYTHKGKKLRKTSFSNSNMKKMEKLKFSKCKYSFNNKQT